MSKTQRKASENEFNNEDSDKAVFLLSTQVVSKDIKLCADTVILFDSESVPYRDVQVTPIHTAFHACKVGATGFYDA